MYRDYVEAEYISNDEWDVSRGECWKGLLCRIVL